jgi:hypothetical protein
MLQPHPNEVKERDENLEETTFGRDDIRKRRKLEETKIGRDENWKRRH